MTKDVKNLDINMKLLLRQWLSWSSPKQCSGDPRNHFLQSWAKQAEWYSAQAWWEVVLLRPRSAGDHKGYTQQHSGTMQC